MVVFDKLVQAPLGQGRWANQRAGWVVTSWVERRRVGDIMRKYMMGGVLRPRDNEETKIHMFVFNSLITKKSLVFYNVGGWT